MPFKIYADFEFLLKGVRSSDKNNASYSKRYQLHIPCSFAYKVVCIDDKFSKSVVLYIGKFSLWIYLSNSWRVWLLQKSDKTIFQ